MLRNRTLRRAGGLTITAAVAVGLLIGVPQALGAPTPPPNPTNGQLNDANARKAALADQVGQLSAQLAAAQQRLSGLQNDVAVAEQKVALQVSKERAAIDRSRRSEQASDRADADLGAARRRLAAEQNTFAQYMQAVYMGGEPTGLTGSLLTADDPSGLLQQSTYERYETQRKAGVIGTMQRLSVTVSNKSAAAQRAASTARAARREAHVETQRRVAALQDAADAYDAQQQQEAAVQASVSQTQTDLDTASEELATLNGQRAKFVAYQQEQARLREIARQKRLAEQRRRAEAERQKELAAQRMRQARAAAKREGRPAPVFRAPKRYAPAAPSSGGWSPAKAQRAVQRARSTLGMPYAWAGGGAGGPSYGACVPSAGAPNDCNVYGYDCSGLVMYAWGKGWDHYADTQYSQAGSFHPSRGQLKPGDLVFFGYRGGGSALHHVAMYIGNGRIIEAPYSGGYVQYNSLYAYGDYYGATRPLT